MMDVAVEQSYVDTLGHSRYNWLRIELWTRLLLKCEH